MTLLTGQQLYAYNHLPCIPYTRPLGDLLNSIAVVSGAAAGTRELFVDTVNGNDDNDGLTSATALQTIQLAALMFKLPLLQTWAKNDNRTITVIHTPGMPKITEQITVPPHNGEGILIADFEEEVIASGLVENGALAAVAGFENRWQITFTTAPLTPAALARNAFTKMHTLQSENEIDGCLENLPIITNGAGTVDVVAADPGIFSAFHYANGAVIDIVRPQIEWGLDEDPVTTTHTLQHTMIKNLGGSPLIIRGVCAATDNTNVNNTCFLSNIGNGVGILGNNVALTRSMAEATTPGAGWWALTFGDAMVAGFIAEADSIYYLTSYASLASAYNVDTDTPTRSTVAASYVDNGLVVGINATGILSLNKATMSAGGSFDVRNGHFVLANYSSCTLFALTVEGAGGFPGLRIGYSESADSAGYNGCTIVDGTRVKGTTGNTDLGCRVGIFGNLFVLSGVPTLSGGVNDLQVGAAAARAWGAGDESDAVLFARFDS